MSGDHRRGKHSDKCLREKSSELEEGIFDTVGNAYMKNILYNSEIGLVVKKSLDTNHTSLAMGKDEHNDGSDKAHTYRGKSRAERAKVHSDNEYRVSYYNENIAAKGNNK
jgi:hypothetical protein